MGGISPSSDQATTETIFTLPEHTSTFAVARACRETALEFLNESPHWGQAELAMWLMGSYSQLTRYAAPNAGPAMLLRDIDPRMVKRVIHTAHEEVMNALRRLPNEPAAASFAFDMMSGGFVARCTDEKQVDGWVPTANPLRLADRVLSLLAVDYLAHPAEYDSGLSCCPQCKTIEFDAIARARGRCSRHGKKNSAAVSQRFGSIPPPSSRPLLA